MFLAELENIEQRLNNEGDTPAVRKAFWQTIGRMKRQDSSDLDDESIEKAAEIRNKLFKQKVVLSVSKGLFLSFIITIIFQLGNIVILLHLESWLSGILILPLTFLITIMNILLLIGSVFIAYGAYPWGRYIGGVIARVKFDGFYRYSPGELGLKIEYTSYLKTTQSRRKWVFGFPIIWVFAFLFIQLPLAWFLNPSGVWVPLILISLFGLFYIVIYYKKTGELYRFVRELRIEREVKRKYKTPP
jgi:hypothetical protein